MPNNNARFNPAYSTIKAIYLANQAGLDESGDNAEKLNIATLNTECVFERIEFVENINDVLPNGVLVVRDIKDIVSRMRKYEIDKIIIEFFEELAWDPWILDVTSVSYINNAASETEENFINIYFSNRYYKLVQTESLNNTLKQCLGLDYPKVEKIDTFVSNIADCFFNTFEQNIDETYNYVLYRPLNTVEDRIESVSDNPLEYLNYLASNAVNIENRLPQYMFWTDFRGGINFKYFDRNCENDSSFTNLEEEYRNFAIYEGESVLQKISKRDDSLYRKCYYYSTNPAYQYISKKYYYIRKTPKVFDNIPAGLSGITLDNYIYSALAYQFKDEGEKYNIEVVGLEGATYAELGADQLYYNGHWGYYDGLESINNSSYLTHLGQNFGTSKNYAQLNLMGSSSYMPYIDTTEMWKNMFDITEVHPNYPNYGVGANGEVYDYYRVPGMQTLLQKLITIRYLIFIEETNNNNQKLNEYRKAELQNFIMYSLCCMGNKEESFFALLTKFEQDNTTTQYNPYAKKYRYQWNKLKFDSAYGPTGPTGSCGATGYYFNEIEKWSLDGLKSSTAQDDTWAINLNERGITSGYLPTGWVYPPPAGFNLRPIGAKSASIGNSGDIFHIVKMYKIPAQKLLDESNNTIYPNFVGKYLYYFVAENALDGNCRT